MRYVLITAIVIALVILGPLASIWALNTLFPVLAIPYNSDTWLSAVILAGVFKTSITKKG